MVIRGHISNGAVQIDGQVPLPDGTRVLVVPENVPAASGGERVVLPLVPSKTPGAVEVDASRIAELLDDDAAP